MDKQYQAHEDDFLEAVLEYHDLPVVENDFGVPVVDKSRFYRQTQQFLMEIVNNSFRRVVERHIDYEFSLDQESVKNVVMDPSASKTYSVMFMFSKQLKDEKKQSKKEVKVDKVKGPKIEEVKTESQKET